MDELDDTAMRPRQRIAAPSGLSFDDTIMRARLPFQQADPSPAEPIPDAAPPAPMELYGIRLSGSDIVIVLDRPAHVGRHPAAPRIPSGFPPRLVHVDSPRHEVSGSHIELRQLGSTVVATDLNSTNGSVIVFPGQEPRSLRRGESMVVTPGALVDIGDGNVIEILPLHQVD